MLDKERMEVYIYLKKNVITVDDGWGKGTSPRKSMCFNLKILRPTLLSVFGHTIGTRHAYIYHTCNVFIVTTWIFYRYLLIIYSSYRFDGSRTKFAREIYYQLNIIVQ